MSKVFVSGCFDLLHSGHIAFLQEAAGYGDLYVALGADATVFRLKGRLPTNTQDERLYMMQALGCVKDAFISTGSGVLDFEAELRALMPDIFFVNADGNIPQKAALCHELDIRYIVREREPHEGLPARSTTALKSMDQMPYRLDLAGGWLDQPFVSQLHPGAVITLSIEPTIAFNERSGMATSTRNSAIDLWGTKLPAGEPEKAAKVLFCYDNPPGTTQISGSQDAIGIAMPGLNYAWYEGEYWASRIRSIHDEMTLQFVEQALYLVPLDPRETDYNPLTDRAITPERAAALATAADACWTALQARDLPDFGSAVRASFEAQIAMFPGMVNDAVWATINQYRDCALGWKLAGAGGGGYLVFVAEQPIQPAVRLVARRAFD